MNLIIYSLLISFTTTFLSIPCLIKFAKKIDLLDIPDNRKIHKCPTVRIGGVSLFFGLVISILIFLFFNNNYAFINLKENISFYFILGGCLFFILGLADDVFNLTPFLRLSLQFLFSFVLWIYGLRIDGFNISINNFTLLDYSFSAGLGLIITCLFIVAVINAFNWIDGIDGLAAGVAIIFFSSLIFLENRDIIFITSLIGSLIAFLIFNLKGSTLMMGDSGSYLLGYLIASMSITSSYSKFYYTNIKSINIVIPFFLLLVPIFDMVRVIFSRIIDRRSIFYPDNMHFHYLLLKKGINERNTLLIILLISILCSTCGLILTL